jgi:hypothetical protein
MPTTELRPSTRRQKEFRGTVSRIAYMLWSAPSVHATGRQMFHRTAVARLDMSHAIDSSPLHPWRLTCLGDLAICFRARPGVEISLTKCTWQTQMSYID